MAEIPTPSDGLAEQVRTFLNAIHQDILILRPGEYCESPSFIDNLSQESLEFLYKLSKLESTAAQAGFCSMRSEKALLAAIRLNSQDILNQAIALGAVAIKCLLRNDPNRGVVVSCFARALKCRWNVTKEDQHLDDAIYYYRKAVEVEPIGDESRALHLDDLGCALWQRFSKTHTTADFEEGRSVLEKAISLPDVAKPACLSHLGRLLKDQAARLEEGKNAALDVSLEIHLQAISSVTKDFRGPPQFLHQNLARAYFERYAVSSSHPTDSLKEFVMEKVNGSGHRWMFLFELAALHRPVFISTGHQSEADKMVDLLRSALVDSPGNVNIMLALADILEQKGIALASQSILTEALHFAEESIKATSEYDQNMPLRLRSAATILAHRFDLGSDLPDIEQAISLGEQGLQSPCLRQVDRWKVLGVLASHLLCRFSSTEDPADLERAQSLLQEALIMPDLPDDAKSSYLREHGKLLYNKYKLDKNPDNIEGSIQSLSSSIELADSQNISVAAAYNDLGNAYSLKFELNGKIDDSRKSIEALLKAIACIDRHPIISVERPMYLHNLANSFFLYHEKSNQVLDLDHAISYYQEALDVTDDLSVQASNRTGALSWALQRKFDLTKDPTYLSQARDSLEFVLVNNPSLRPRDVAFLENRLGGTYIREFCETQDTSLLDKAADCFRKVAKDSGCSVPEFINPGFINLARTLMHKYEITKTDEDMKAAAARVFQLPKKLLNPSIREMRGLLGNAGKFCSLVYDTTKRKPFGIMAILFYKLLVNEPTTSSLERVHSAMMQARLQYEVNLNGSEAISSLALAVELMSEAIMMGSNRADQLRAAKQMAWLPGHIIAFGLAAGNTPGDIIQLFERGRSFIWNRLVDQNTEISDLREAHQDLANTFEVLREQLTRTRAQSQVIESVACSRLLQHDVAVEYNSVLKLIRQQEGFENFLLLPARVSRLQDYASFGPIVVLNVTLYRSDAIIIKSEGIVHVPLPLFTLRDCLLKGIELQNALNDEDMEAGSTLFHSVLTWIWEVVAHPVLEELGFVGSCQPGESLPRVWWAANERIASLPVHAAGDHKRALETGASCSVIDRTVSSYIPTLRFLGLSRERAASLHSEQHTEAPGTALLVQMPTTPNDKDLVNVSVEVEAVESILSSRLQITNMDRPKRSRLLPSLSSCTMAHFACHGVAHPEDPSLSQIKLQDWLYSPLDVRFLLKTPMPKCQFVYLSACETALNKATGLREEAIHLSSAFQMAGVPYSVGTSWKIDDSFSVDIAEDFYSNLVQMCDGLDFSRSSYALHNAVMKARGRGVDAMLWAAYIHSGA
jgi:tetratricopeptide (TPR) repeat protein